MSLKWRLMTVIILLLWRCRCYLPCWRQLRKIYVFNKEQWISKTPSKRQGERTELCPEESASHGSSHGRPSSDRFQMLAHNSPGTNGRYKYLVLEDSGVPWILYQTIHSTWNEMRLSICLTTDSLTSCCLYTSPSTLNSSALEPSDLHSWLGGDRGGQVQTGMSLPLGGGAPPQLSQQLSVSCWVSPMPLPPLSECFCPSCPYRGETTSGTAVSGLPVLALPAHWLEFASVSSLLYSIHVRFCI